MAGLYCWHVSDRMTKNVQEAALYECSMNSMGVVILMSTTLNFISRKSGTITAYKVQSIRKHKILSVFREIVENVDIFQITKCTFRIYQMSLIHGNMNDMFVGFFNNSITFNYNHNLLPFMMQISCNEP